MKHARFLIFIILVYIINCYSVPDPWEKSVYDCSNCSNFTKWPIIRFLELQHRNDIPLIKRLDIDPIIEINQDIFQTQLGKYVYHTEIDSFSFLPNKKYYLIRAITLFARSEACIIRMAGNTVVVETRTLSHENSKGRAVFIIEVDNTPLNVYMDFSYLSWS